MIDISRNDAGSHSLKSGDRGKNGVKSIDVTGNGAKSVNMGRGDAKLDETERNIEKLKDNGVKCAGRIDAKIKRHCTVYGRKVGKIICCLRLPQFAVQHLVC